MSYEERSYFQYRAEVELERAQAASAPEAVRVHYQFAEAYLDKVASVAATSITKHGPTSPG